MRETFVIPGPEARTRNDGVMPCSDRRPILLANARIVDPSRDLDFPGDLLIGRRRHPRGQARHRRRRRAGRHRGDRLPRQAGRAGSDRHARLHRRAGRRLPRDARLGEPGRRRRRRHHHHLPARHLAGDRRSRHRRFRAAPRARHRDRARASDGGHDQGSARRGDDRDRPAQGGRRGRLHRRRQKHHQCAGDAARADLCRRFRRADRAPHRGSRSRRRRRHERGRVRRPPRSARHSEGGGDRHAGARHPPRRADRRALPRRLAHLRGIARGAGARQGGRAARQRRGLDQSPDPQRKRHRPLPHLPQAGAAACAPRTTARRWSRRSPPG